MTIRKAIGDSGQTQQCIETVHGRGYRFAAEVSVHTNARRVDAFSPTTVALDQRGRGDRSSPAPASRQATVPAPSQVKASRANPAMAQSRRSATSAQPPAALRRARRRTRPAGAVVSAARQGMRQVGFIVGEPGIAKRRCRCVCRTGRGHAGRLGRVWSMRR
jgi:hypothetical protein